MNRMSDRARWLIVVIGVDHVHTHSAAVLDTLTGGVLDEITVEATAQGYAELVESANNHAMLRAWALEGARSRCCRRCGAGRWSCPPDPPSFHSCVSGSARAAQALRQSSSCRPRRCRRNEGTRRRRCPHRG